MNINPRQTKLGSFHFHGKRTFHISQYDTKVCALFRFEYVSFGESHYVAFIWATPSFAGRTNTNLIWRQISRINQKFSARQVFLGETVIASGKMIKSCSVQFLCTILPSEVNRYDFILSCDHNIIMHTICLPHRTNTQVMPINKWKT